jgi:hypothetical protein
MPYASDYVSRIKVSVQIGERTFIRTHLAYTGDKQDVVTRSVFKLDLPLPPNPTNKQVQEHNIIKRLGLTNELHSQVQLGLPIWPLEVVKPEPAMEIIKSLKPVISNRVIDIQNVSVAPLSQK